MSDRQEGEKQLQEFLEITNKKIIDDRDLTKIMAFTSKLEFFAMINRRYKNSIIQKLFIQSMKIQKFQPFQTVFKKDDYGDKFYLIITGQVSIINKAKGSSFQMNKTLGKGQYFGELALINNMKRSATVKVGGTETILGYIEKQAFGIIFKNVYDDIFLNGYSIISSSFTEHWNKYKKRMFYSSSFIIQTQKDQIILEKDSAHADGILIVLSGEIQMYQINEKTGEEIPLVVLKQNDIVNEEQFLASQAPIYTSRCISQNAQLLYLSKDDFVTKLLSDKETYSKIIKLIENKQSIIRLRLEKIKNNELSQSQILGKAQRKSEEQQEREELIDNYISPTFKIPEPSEEKDYNSYGEKIDSCLQNNNDDQYILKIRNSSFFEISFSDDHFQTSPQDYISPAILYKKEIQKRMDEENFYDLDSDESSYSSSSSSSSLGQATSSFQTIQNNQQQQQLPLKQNDIFSFRIIQEGNKLETIKECIDEIRSSENLNLKSIDEDEDEEKQNAKSLSSASSLHSPLPINSLNSELEQRKKQINILNYIKNKGGQQVITENKNIQEIKQMRSNIKQFEQHFSSLNQLPSSSVQQIQVQNFIEPDLNPNKKYLPEKIVSDSRLSENSRRNNFQVNSEDFIDQFSSSRQQDSFFEVSNEGMNSITQEEVNIIQKDQLIQNNMTRNKQIIGQIGSGSALAVGVTGSQINFNQNTFSKQSSKTQSPLSQIQQNSSNKSNKNNINMIQNKDTLRSSGQDQANFSPLKERYLERIKNKQLTVSKSSNGSPNQSPMKKSLSSYKKILNNKIIEYDNSDFQEIKGFTQVNLSEQFNKTEAGIQTREQLSEQDYQGSDSKSCNNYPQFMSPIDQKLTMSTQISPRLYSLQDVEIKNNEEQFNLSQSLVSQSQSTTAGAVLINNSIAQKKNQSHFSLKNQLSNLKNKGQKENQIKIEIAVDSHQNIKRNSVLTTSNESELNDDTEGVQQQPALLNTHNKKNISISQSNSQNASDSNKDKFNIIPITFQDLEYKTYDLSTPVTQADNQSLNKQTNEIFIDNSPKYDLTNLVKEEKKQIPNQEQSQKLPIPPIKVLQDKAKLTQKQQVNLQKLYNQNNKLSEENAKKWIQSHQKQLSSEKFKYVVNTEEGSRSKKVSNDSQIEQNQKHNPVNNNNNNLNFFRVNIAKLKKSESKKQQSQPNNLLINNIFGRSLKEQKLANSKDISSSPKMINTQKIQLSINSGSGSQSKDNSYSGIHHRFLKQTPSEIFKKSAEQSNQQQTRSKSSLNNNITEKKMSFNEMYNVYKSSLSKNTSCININNQSQMGSQKLIPTNATNSTKSKSQDLRNKLIITNQNQQQNYNFMSSINISKEDSVNQSKDVSPHQTQVIKDIQKKNSINLIRRKDIHSGATPFKNMKKQEIVYRSANISPARKVSSQLLHGIGQSKEIQGSSPYQQIRRQTNPDVVRGVKTENQSALYQVSYDSKPKILLQKDFENFENAFRQYQKGLSKRDELQSKSLDSSFKNGIIENNNSQCSNANPKMYASLLSQLMNEQQPNQQQQQQVQQISFLEQFQQNRKNSGLSNIKKLIYTQLKESNNTTSEQKRDTSGAAENIIKDKDSKNKGNMIKQIYQKRFSQIF